MNQFKLEDMTKGWFVGDFSPTAFSSSAVEAALKKYKAGDKEMRHVHKVATEVTLIVSGKVEMNKVALGQGDIMVLEPGESSDFSALEDSVLMVVKTPCVKGDKYPAED